MNDLIALRDALMEKTGAYEVYVCMDGHDYVRFAVYIQTTAILPESPSFVQDEACFPLKTLVGSEHMEDMVLSYFDTYENYIHADTGF